jgi:hypothetical protein
MTLIHWLLIANLVCVLSALAGLARVSSAVEDIERDLELLREVLEEFNEPAPEGGDGILIIPPPNRR